MRALVESEKRIGPLSREEIDTVKWVEAILIRTPGISQVKEVLTRVDDDVMELRIQQCWL